MDSTLHKQPSVCQSIFPLNMWFGANLDNNVMYSGQRACKEGKGNFSTYDKETCIWFRCSWQQNQILLVKQRASRVRGEDWRKLTVQPAARRMSSWVSNPTWGYCLLNGKKAENSCCSHGGGQSNSCMAPVLFFFLPWLENHGHRNAGGTPWPLCFCTRFYSHPKSGWAGEAANTHSEAETMELV